MKKFILLILFFSVNFAAVAQTDNDKIIYKAVGMSQTIMNSKSEVIIDKPYAKKITIAYDQFFKSYYITFYTENGDYKYFQFYYVSKYADGKITKMRDDKNHFYNIVDNIEKNGTLLIQMEDRLENNHSMMFAIYGIE